MPQAQALGQVVAGRARIPLQHVGEVVPLDAEGVRRQAGVDADARALLSVNQPDGFDCPGCAWPDRDRAPA